MVCKLLGVQPSAKVVHHFYRKSWVLVVKVSLLHLLKNVCENAVHKLGQICRAIGLTKLLICFHLIDSIPQVDDKLIEKPQWILTELIFNFENKFSKHLIDMSGISLSIKLMLIFFLVLLPVIFDILQILLILLAQLLYLLFSLLLFVHKRKIFV